MKIKRILASGVVVGASALGLVATQSSPAGAASTVNVGGTATCQMVGLKPIAASSVTISAAGRSARVGTSGLPWKYGRYDLSLPYLPNSGTWGTMTVNCPKGSYHAGNHTKNVWLKPDWRNTTGDTSWRNI